MVIVCIFDHCSHFGAKLEIVIPLYYYCRYFDTYISVIKMTFVYLKDLFHVNLPIQRTYM
jgi:hypothetical protein